MFKIKKIIKNIISKIKIQRVRLYTLRTEGANIKSIKHCLSLSSEEKKQLTALWGVFGLKIYDDFYKMFKTLDKFNPAYVSDDLYYPHIIRALNPIEYSVAFSHKAIYGQLFNNIRQPSTYVKRIRGEFYDQTNRVISKEEAIQLTQNLSSFIIKPTIDTSVGKNVYKVTNPSDTNINELYDNVGKDFIIQEVVSQSEQTAALNPTSLNTLRISTLYLNGEFSVSSIVIKMGRDDLFVDNLGAGGLILGVQDDGKLKDFAYDNKYNRYYNNGNYTFKGKHIEGIDKIKQFVKKLHTEYIPYVSFVGWDIALDINNEPVLIEVNLKWPGIQFEQLCCTSPLFGDRTKEVIKYVQQYYE